MISLKDQYYIIFSLGDVEDFVKESELNEFTIIEEAGSALPTFLLEFNTDDDRILPRLNESTSLRLVFGKDVDSSFDVPLYVSTMRQINNGDGAITVSVKGLLDKTAYLSLPVLNITAKQSGVAAAMSAASNNFKVDSNVATSIDSQSWIQANSTDKNFISNALLHANGGSSFFASAITIDGKFRIRDVKKHILTSFGLNYDWRFTTKPALSNDILYDGAPAVTSKNGFLNTIAGYGKEVYEQVLESGIVNKLLEKPSQIMALTRDLAIKSSLDKKFGGTAMLNDNVHSKYWSCYWHNLSNLIILGNLSIVVTIDKEFRSIHPLDTVMLDIPSTDSKSTSEHLSGMYYVSKVSRTLSMGRFSTTVGLCRESVNNIKVE